MAAAAASDHWGHADDEEALEKAIAASTPTVGRPEPIEAVADEYHDNPKLGACASSLGGLGYTRIRRMRPDGACFYRAWMFGLVKFLVEGGASYPAAELRPITGSEESTAPSASSSSASSASSSSSSSSASSSASSSSASSSSASSSASALPPMLALATSPQAVYERLISVTEGSLARFNSRLGISSFIAEDFVGVFQSLLQGIPSAAAQWAVGGLTDAEQAALLEEAAAAVVGETDSQYATAYCRYVASTAVEELSDVVAPTVAAMGSKSVAEYRAQCVEATKAEADHLAIACFASLTGIPVAIVSLSASSAPSIAVFPAGASADDAPVHMLLRPGHYDLLER